MRVITGTARGRRLKELEGIQTRPTTDRVKEGMFNVLQFQIEGRRVLDLFAGTGQLGIECLSRRAESAVFVEQRQDALKLIRENLRCTDLARGARVVAGEALAFLASAGKGSFDLIFLDPPYATELEEQALERIVRFDILSPHGIIVAEHPADKHLPVLEPPYRLGRTYRYGKIAFTTFSREEERQSGGMIV